MTFYCYLFICLFIYFVFQAVDQGRIYALRYELCDGLARSPDLTDKDPQREMWNFFSPIALFASKPISWGKSELLPLAIQMDFKPGMYESTYFPLTRIYTKKWKLVFTILLRYLLHVLDREWLFFVSQNHVHQVKKRQINGKRRGD